MAEPTFASQATGLAEQLLSPGEALLLLILLVGAVLLGLSTLLAAATMTARKRAVARDRARAARYERWKALLQSVLYEDGDAEELSSSVDGDHEADFLDFLLLYARRLGGDERDKIIALAAPHMGQVVDLLDARSEERRMRAVQTLGELGLPEHGAAVVAALDDPSPLVAMAAAATLSSSRDADFASEVLARLHRFGHWRRDFLAAMLASMGPEAGDDLRRRLADPETPESVRTVAADALAALDDPGAADLAHEVLESHPGAELQAACLRVLTAVGRGEHLPRVRRYLDASELPVRLHAVRAVGQLGSEDDRALLVQRARNDESPWVAIAAARGLKESGGVAALESLAGSDHPRAALGLQVMTEVASW